ncbi:MAG: cupin domain-containing protein [Actinomycetota bacterium]|nr:cupin domain-containing protein [Actinomycetota bacterium]
MVTRTTTRTTHWEVQWTRRRKLIEEWRQYRRKVIHGDDVELSPTARGILQGVYMGVDGGNPTRSLDALVQQIDPGAVSTVHRHSWDAITFVVSGSGWTEIDGVRYDWKPWDSLHLPAWAWHRSGNDGDTPARVLTYSSEPTLDVLGMAVLDDRGSTDVADLPGRPEFTEHAEGDDPYARRVRRLGAEQQQRRSGRLYTDYEELPLMATPKGTRAKFLNDRTMGHQASGLTQVMIQFAPGKGQAMHRHPGEAWLYVVDGYGHSYWGDDPTGGETHEWKTGDMIVVDHSQWHQHFNDDPDNPTRLVRIHMFDSVLETMRVLCDPIDLFEEPPESIAAAPDISDVEFPEDRRPQG